MKQLNFIQGDPSLYPLDWSEEKIIKFRQTLMAWYDKTKRDLPWRDSGDAYKVWVSEIMAQQTQLVTVIPYYERFIAELPTIQSLADAPEEIVLGLWQGLGYYSRARNMQKAAQQIMTEFAGEMPKTMKELMTLKGIGPYTAAAIGSIVYDLVEPAIDGNLMRVIARLFELENDISQPSSRKVFAAILYQLIDPQRPGDFNQALMDLGAIIMTPANLTPDLNPLKEFDLSYINQTAHLYPVKKKKTKASVHHLVAYLIENDQGQWLMRRHEETELLTGLWHFPIIEHSIVMEAATEKELVEPIEEWYYQQFNHLGIDLTTTEYDSVFKLHEDYWNRSYPPTAHRKISPIKHIFSHRIWHIDVLPVRLRTLTEAQVAVLSDNDNSILWVWPHQVQRLPLSTLQQKLLYAVNGEIEQ